MVDSFTEVEDQSWFSRIGGAFKGLLIGGALFLVSFPVLFINEKHSVETARSLEEGSGAVVSISADSIDSANEGKLIHFSGLATTDEELTDTMFDGVKVVALGLQRNAEMYQWEEEKHTRKENKPGGGTRKITEYSYEQVWSQTLIDSSKFHQKGRADHVNPNQMPVRSGLELANKVTVGAFQLSAPQIASVENDSRVELTEEVIPEKFAGEMKLDGNTLYLGSDSSTPQIGDTRIEFVATKPAEVSIVAQQNGNSLQAYQTKAGQGLDMLRMGKHSADEMFALAKADNDMMTWIFRGVGALVMFIGLIMLTKPISVLADIIPFLGGFVEMGMALLAGLITISLSAATIGFAWLFFRPLIGVPLLVVSVGALVMLFMKRSRGRSARSVEVDL